MGRQHDTKTPLERNLMAGEGESCGEGAWSLLHSVQFRS